MLPSKQAILSFKSIHFMLTRNYNKVLCPVSQKIILNELQTDGFNKSSFQNQFRRELHITKVNRDIETGLRALGGGLAATGVVGSGIGLGVIFGNYLSGIARNPSVSNKLLTAAMMGAAFCESLGLFALVLSFIILP